MMTLVFDCRTVALISRDNEGNLGMSTMRDGRKKISYRVAIKTGKTIEKADGSKEQETVFRVLTAFDKVAETLSKYATDKKESGGIVSRHLMVSGTINFYKGERKQKINGGGILYELNGEKGVLDTGVEENDKLYVIEENADLETYTAYSIQFLDSNSERKIGSSSSIKGGKLKSINIKNKINGEKVSMKQEIEIPIPDSAVNTSNGLPEMPEMTDNDLPEVEEPEIPQVAEDFSGIETPFN